MLSWTSCRIRVTCDLVRQNAYVYDYLLFCRHSYQRFVALTARLLLSSQCCYLVMCCDYIFIAIHDFPFQLYNDEFSFYTSRGILVYITVIISAMASQITCVPIIYLTIYSGANQRKHQSSASLAFVGENDRWPANSPHKGPVTRKMFLFDDVIIYVTTAMNYSNIWPMMSQLMPPIF